MVNLTVNGKNISVKEGTTILEAAQQNGILIPTLCFLKDINEIGACRICVVEIEGMERLAAACNNTVEEGMVVYTNSPKVMASRKSTLELILSEHEYSCATCSRCGNCQLQSLAEEFGLSTDIYKKKIRKIKWNRDFPLIRDNEKCIKCMRCIQICEKVQALGVWDVCGTGARTTVDVKGGVDIDKADCSVCGQCITHCPVGALHERDDKNTLYEALADKTKVKIVQVAPAVRAAWGEELGLSPDKATIGRMGEALRQLGFDYVFDTDFSADLTIMEEGSEFLKRFSDKENYTFPMFTSCCPGWVRFMRTQYPDMVSQLSTAKSPQQMFGAVVKSYFAEKIGKDPKDIISVSIMPCVAKKAEAAYGNMGSEERGRDVDIVLTTRELIKMIKAANINVSSLEEKPLDDPLSDGTGAAVIFGTTGGVMEAALRSAYFLVTGSNPDPDAFKAVRGYHKGWNEAEFDLAGAKVRCAVASGLGNTRQLIEAIRSGEVSYDFVEIMACPGGCAGGGGQPIHPYESYDSRGEILRKLDTDSKLRFSHENPSVQKLYSEYLIAPLGEKSHHLLHTDHEGWAIK
ncbi:MAG: hydrogenase [Ruminococcaceae bacterium]|jgi:NADH-quinone oxidoreductase subunit G|nr:hydrogenase [Oscillospiraceae bacterium]